MIRKALPVAEWENILAEIILLYVSYLGIVIRLFLAPFFWSVDGVDYCLLFVDFFGWLIAIHRTYKTKLEYYQCSLASVVVVLDILILFSFPSLGPWIFFLKLLRTIKVFDGYRQLHDFVQKHSFNGLTNCLKFSQYFISFSTLVLFLASLWWLVSCAGFGTSEPHCNEQNWIDEDHSLLTSLNPFSAALRSIYFIVVTLFTVGYGDIYPQTVGEMLLDLPIMLLGGAWSGLIISLLSASLRSNNAVYINFRSKLLRLNAIMNVHNISDEIHESVIEYKNRVYETQLDYEETTMIETLPQFLAREIKKEAFQAALHNVAWLKHLTDDQLVCLLDYLKFYSVPSGYVSNYSGDDCNQITVVRKGKFGLSSSNGDEIQGIDLVIGDSIGDFEYFEKSRFEYSYIAKVPSDVAVISVSTIDGIVGVENKNICDAMKSACSVGYNSRLFRIRAVQNAAVKAGTKLGMQVNDIEMTNDLNTWFWLPNYTKTYWLFGINVLMMIFSIIGIFFLSCNSPMLDKFSPLVVFCIVGEILLLFDVVVICVDYSASMKELPEERILASYWQCDFKTISGIAGQLIGTIPVFMVYSCGAVHANRLFILKIFCLMGIHSNSIRVFQESEKRFTVIPSYVEKMMSLFQQFWIILTTIVGFASGFTGLHFKGDQKTWLNSVYWCLTTVTTTGYGDITPNMTTDTVLSIFVIIIGPIVFASVIAYIVTFIQGVGYEDSALHKHLVYKQLIHVLSDATYSLESKTSCVLHCNQALLLSDLYERREKIYYECGLPIECKSWLREILLRDFLYSFKILRKCSSSFRRDLASTMEQLLVLPDTNITDQNPLCGLYFIKQGIVKVGKPGATTRKFAGDIIGEDCLLGETNELLQICSLMNCELWFLSSLRFRYICSRLCFAEDEAVIRGSLEKSLPSLHLNGRRRNLLVPKTQLDTIINNFKKQRSWVIDPSSSKLKAWNLVVLSNLIILGGIIPYQVAFSSSLCNSVSTVEAFTYVVDAVLLLDGTLHSFFIGHMDERGEPITDHCAIFWNAVKMKMVYAFLVTCFPTQVILLTLGSNAYCQQQLQAILRLNRFCRFILQDLRGFGHYILELKHFNTTNCRFTVKLVESFFLILLIAHICGCAYFLISRLEDNFGVTDTWWSYFSTCGKSCSDAVKYTASIYWAVTVLATVGYGDICPKTNVEKFFNIVVFGIGTLLLALIIGSFQRLSTESNYSMHSFMRHVKDIEVFLTREGKIDNKSSWNAYCQLLWDCTKGVSPEDLQDLFDDRLYAQLMYYSLKANFEETFFFKNCSLDFLLSLSKSLRIEVFLADEILFKVGEVSDNLYFVVQGEISLANTSEERKNQRRDSFRGRSSLVAKKSIYTTIYNGPVGTSEFFSRSCYSCNGLVMTDSIIIRLNFNDFRKSLQEFGLTGTYHQYFLEHQVGLERTSTAAFVQNFDGNFSNKKMLKMLSENLPINSSTIFYGPESLVSRVFNLGWGLLCLVQVVFTPLLACYVPQSVVLPIIIDSLFLGYTLIGMYLKSTSLIICIGDNTVADYASHIDTYKKSGISKDFFYLVIVFFCQLAVFLGHKVYYQVRWISLVVLYEMPSFLYFVFVSLGKLQKDGFSAAASFCFMIYLCHVFGAILIIVGCHEALAHEESWLVKNDLQKNIFWYNYLTGIYWAMYTLTTVGYGSVSLATEAERWVALCAMIIGSIFSAHLSTVVGSIAEHYVYQNDFERSINRARSKYMASNQVGFIVAEQVSCFHRYVEVQLEGVSDDRVFKHLPNFLKSQYRMVLCDALTICDASLITSHFLSTPEVIKKGLLYYISKKAVPYLAVPSETILKMDLTQHDILGSVNLFYLRRGKVQSKWGNRAKIINYEKLLNDYQDFYSQQNSSLRHFGIQFLKFSEKEFTLLNETQMSRIKICVGNFIRTATWIYESFNGSEQRRCYRLESFVSNELFSHFEPGMVIDIYACHDPVTDLFQHLGRGIIGEPIQVSSHSSKLSWSSELLSTPTVAASQKKYFRDIDGQKYESSGIRKQWASFITKQQSFAQIYPFLGSHDSAQTDSDGDDHGELSESRVNHATSSSADFVGIGLRTSDSFVVPIYDKKGAWVSNVGLSTEVNYGMLSVSCSTEEILRIEDSFSFLSFTCMGYAHLMSVDAKDITNVLKFYLDSANKESPERVHNLCVKVSRG